MVSFVTLSVDRTPQRPRMAASSSCARRRHSAAAHHAIQAPVPSVRRRNTARCASIPLLPRCPRLRTHASASTAAP